MTCLSMNRTARVRTTLVTAVFVLSFAICPRRVRGFYEPDCNDPDAALSLCAEPTKDLIEQLHSQGYPYYIGHAEPTALFFSRAANSGSNMQWKFQLPATDPSPMQDGSSVANFELYPTFWIGLAICDPNSRPYGACTAASDANNPNTAGAAVLELQFYPPGSPFGGCSSSQWCARLTIDSLHTNLGQTSCAEPIAKEYITTDGTPTPGGSKLLMSNGDSILVTVHDTASGLEADVNDLTSASTGSMVASGANGFMHNANQTDCTLTAFDFHAMYATASPGQIVPWAALRLNVAFDFEIGHFELCGDTSCSIKPGGGDADDTSCGTYRGVGACVNAKTGDPEHDGISYRADWPDGTAAHPASVVLGAPNDNGVGPLSFTSGTGNYDAGYDTLAFRTTEPTTGPFYPFFSQAFIGPVCRFNFGNDIPGMTWYDFGKATQYGTTMANPCFPSDVCTPGTGLHLTAAGTAEQFTLTTTATGFAPVGNVGPLGIAFSGANLLVTDAAGDLRRFADSLSPVDVSGISPLASYGSANALGLAYVSARGGGTKYYMTQQTDGRVVEINPTTGALKGSPVANIPGATGIVPFPPAITGQPLSGHLFVSQGFGSSTIWDVDPINKVTRVFTNTGADGLAVTPDGTILFAADGSDVLGFDTSTGNQVTDSNFLFCSTDGVAIGTGSLKGRAYANCNEGDVWEVVYADANGTVPATPLRATRIACGGTRGDFVASDALFCSGAGGAGNAGPCTGTETNRFPSLLLTQSDQIIRLDPPNGGFVGPPGSSVFPPPLCGDGLLGLGEECDDGNGAGGDGCPANCSYTTSGVLIRGDLKTPPKRDSRGCQVEWYVVNPGNPPDRYGAPNVVQTCTDQDPSCDISGFDPAGQPIPDVTPDLCRFQVVVCLNNEDANLPACVPDGVTSVAVLRPTPRASQPPAIQSMLGTDRTALVTAVDILVDPFDPGGGYTNGAPLNAGQRGFCSAPFEVGAMPGPGGSVRLETLSFGASFHRRLSSLRLTCKGS